MEGHPLAPAEKTLVTTAAALLIGSELLTGKIADLNLQRLAATLRALGVQLKKAVFVLDDRQTIASELRLLAREHDVVFTSGGVGPTHDDITVDAVADAFSTHAEHHPLLENLLRQEYGPQLSDAHQRLALVPHGAELIVTDEVRWPTITIQNVWVLPGIPEIFRAKLAVVRERLRGPVQFFTRAVYTQLDEASLKNHLDATVRLHPDVEVGSYPKWFDSSYRTKVTFDASDQQRLAEAIMHFCSYLPAGEPVRMD